MRNFICIILIGITSSAVLVGQGTGADIPTAVSIASDGYIYVTGASVGLNGTTEYVTLAYSSQGTVQVVQRLTGNSTDAGIPSGIIVSGNNVVVTGTSSGQSSGYDILTVMYNRSSIVSVSSGLPTLIFELEQNYPNPVNPHGVATITFSLPTEGHVRLSVVDVVGKEVEVLVDESRRAGRYQILFYPNQLPAGIYFYILSSNRQTEVKRLMVIR